MQVTQSARITGAVLAALILVTVLVWAPVAASFAVVVASATAWCVWLERHPEA